LPEVTITPRATTPWEAHAIQMRRNPEGMKTIDNAIREGGNIAGAFGTGVLFAPAVLEGLASGVGLLAGNAGRSIVGNASRSTAGGARSFLNSRL